MFYRERLVTLIGPDGATRGLLAWQRRAERHYAIALYAPAGFAEEAGADLFAALTALRLRLEPFGWLIAVQGARPGARPAGPPSTRVLIEGDETREMLADADPALLVVARDPG